MEKINQFFKSNIFSSVLLFILGFILTIKPDTVISIIAYAVAIILLAVGINAIIKYIQDNNQRYNLFGGIISLTASIFLFFKYEMVISFIPFFIGLYIIINSALRIEYIFRLKNENNPKYINMLVTVVLSFVCGLFLVFNPFSSTLTITRIVGIFIMIYSVMDIYQSYVLRKEIENFIK